MDEQKPLAKPFNRYDYVSMTAGRGLRADWLLREVVTDVLKLAERGCTVTDIHEWLLVKGINIKYRSLARWIVNNK